MCVLVLLPTPFRRAHGDECPVVGRELRVAACSRRLYCPPLLSRFVSRERAKIRLAAAAVEHSHTNNRGGEKSGENVSCERCACCASARLPACSFAVVAARTYGHRHGCWLKSGCGDARMGVRSSRCSEKVGERNALAFFTNQRAPAFRLLGKVPTFACIWIDSCM